jgi:phage-related protein
MAIDTQELTFKLVVDSDGAVQGLERVADATEDVGKASKKAAKEEKKFADSLDAAFKSVVALNQGLEIAKKVYNTVNNAITTLTDAYAVQEAAEKRLASTLELTGQLTKSNLQDFKDFASQLQEVSVIGDEVSLSFINIAKAQGLTDRTTVKLVKSAANLSAARGIALEAAFSQLLKTTGGFAGELGEVIPELKALTKEQLQAGQAIDLVTEKFQGQAEALTKTFSGASIQAVNSFGDALEKLGGILVDTFRLDEAAKATKTFFDNLNTALAKTAAQLKKTDFKKLSEDLEKLAGVVALVLLPAMIKLATTIAVLAAPVVIVALKISALVAVLTSVGLAVDIVIRNFDKMGEVMTAAVNGMIALWGKFIGFFIKTGMKITKFMKEWVDQFKDTEGVAGKMATGVSKGLGVVVKKAEEVEQAIGVKVADAVEKAKEGFAGLDDQGALGAALDIMDEIDRVLDPGITSSTTQAKKKIDDFNNSLKKTVKLTKEEKALLDSLPNKTIELEAEILELQRQQEDAGKTNLRIITDRALMTESALSSVKELSQKLDEINTKEARAQKDALIRNALTQDYLEANKLTYAAVEERDDLIKKAIERQKQLAVVVSDEAAVAKAERDAKRVAIAQEIAANKEQLEVINDIIKNRGLMTASGTALLLDRGQLAAFAELGDRLLFINSQLKRAEEFDLTLGESLAQDVAKAVEWINKNMEWSIPFSKDQEAAMAAFIDKFNNGLMRGTDLITEAIEEPTKALGNAVRVAGEGFKGILDGFSDLDGIFNNVFSNAIGDMFDSIGEGLSSVFDPMSDAISQMWKDSDLSIIFSGLTKSLSGVFEGIDLGGLFENIDIGEIFAEGMGAMATILDKTVSTVVNGTQAMFSVAEFFGSFTKEFLKGMMDLPSLMAEGMKNLGKLFEQLPQLILDIMNTFLTMAPKLITQIFSRAWIDAFMEALTVFAQQLPGLITMILQRIPEMIRGILAALPDLITAIFDAIPAIMADLFDMVPEILIDILSALPEILERVIKGIIGSIGKIVAAFIDTFITKGGAVELAGAIITALLKAIPAIIDGIATGVKNALAAIFGGFKWPLPDITDITNKIEDFFQKIPQVADQVFAVIDLPEEGRKALTPGEDIKEAVKQAKRVVNGLMKLLSKWWNELTKVWRAFWKGLMNGIHSVIQFVGEVATMAVEGLKAVWDFAAGIVRSIWDFLMQLGSTIGDLFSSAWEGLKKALSSVFQLFTKAANMWIGGVNDVFAKVWEDYLAPWINAVNSVFAKVWDDFLKPWINGVNSVFQNAFTDIINFFNGLPNLMTQAGNNLASGVSSLIDGFNRIFESLDIGKIGRELGDAVGNSIVNLIKMPMNTLIDLLNGLRLQEVKVGGKVLGKGFEFTLIPNMDFLPGTIPRFAEGGPVSGIFDGTDNQLIAAQPGEFVLNRGAVSSIGSETAAFINRTGQLPKSGSTTNNTVMVEPGAIVVTQRENEDGEELANRIIEMLKERSAAGQTVIFDSGIRSA